MQKARNAVENKATGLSQPTDERATLVSQDPARPSFRHTGQNHAESSAHPEESNDQERLKSSAAMLDPIPEPQHPLHDAKTASDVFLEWYTPTYTRAFAAELSGFSSQDGSQAQTKLISMCIQLHASTYAPEQHQIAMQTAADLPGHESTFGHVSSWL